MFQTLVHYTKAWINYYIFVQRFNHQHSLLFYKTFDRRIKDKAMPVLQCPQVMDLDGVFGNVI
mgnify:CR=1 FL=1